MERPVEELAAKIDALDAWDTVLGCNWAIKPRGSAIPYFCSALKDDAQLVKVRLLLLEGWQTFHDFIRTRVDRDFGFYLSPMELPHFELAVLRNGTSRLFRHDPGYIPQPPSEAGRALCAKMLWEVYGVMMRLESDGRLPLRFADEKALFARVEHAEGEWSDEPLVIPEPRPHVERVSFAKKDLSAAKDIPLCPEDVVELDLAIVHGMMTREPRPRLLYLFSAADADGAEIFRDRLSVNPETGLRGLWENLPPRLLKHFLVRRRVPGEIRVRSGRLFRLLRPLGMQLPFKLVKCTALPGLDKLDSQTPQPA